MSIFISNDTVHAFLSMGSIDWTSIDVHLPKALYNMWTSIDLIGALPGSVSVFGTIGGSILTACPASMGSDFLLNNQIASLQYVLSLINTTPPSGENVIYSRPLFSIANNIHYNSDVYAYLVQQALYWFFHIWCKLTPVIFAMLVFLLRGNPRLISFLLFFMQIPRATAPILISNLHRDRIITLVFTWLSYIFSFASYDSIFREWARNRGNISMFRYSGGYPIFTREYLLGRLRLGLLFFIVINLGVLFSNVFWALTTVEPYTIQMWGGLSGSLAASTICSSIWISFRGLDPGWMEPVLPPSLLFLFRFVLSLLRCLVESFAFNALSWANYSLWALWSTVDLSPLWLNLVPLLSGLGLYFPISLLQMWLETNADSPLLYSLYGIIYTINFTLLSWSSSGLFGLYSMSSTLQTDIVIAVFTGIIITVFPMQVYRRPGTGSPRRYLIESLYQLCMFYSFVFFTFIWQDYTGLI